MLSITEVFKEKLSSSSLALY